MFHVQYQITKQQIAFGMKKYLDMVLRWFVAVFAVSYVRWADGKVNIQAIIYSLANICPLTQLCNGTLSSSRIDTLGFPMLDTCCAACFCSDDCKARNNCCPFFEPLESEIINRIPTQECTGSYTNPDFNTRFRYANNMYDGVLFNAITTCRVTFQNNETRTKCEGNVSAEFLEDVVLVSDSKDFVYKNRFCAECNGVSNYTTWLLNAKCFPPNIDYHPTKDVFKDSECMFWSVPPNDELQQKTICHKGYDKCNQTGEWDVYDAELEDACEAYTLEYFYVPTETHAYVYKNVHCFMCNSKQSLIPANSCNFGPNDEVMRSVYPVKSFTAILNMQALDLLRQPVPSRVNCLQNELYDPYYRTCRELFCPVLFIPAFGKCVNKFLTTKYLAIVIFIELVTDILLTECTDINLPQFAYDVKNALKLEINNCGYCSLYIKRQNASRTVSYLVMAQYHTTERCDADLIVRLIDTFLNNASGNIIIEVNNRRISFATKLSDEFQTIDDLFEPDYTDLKIICRTYIILKETLNCPSIELSETEYNILLTNTGFDGRNSRLVHKKNNFTNTTGTRTEESFGFKVCVDDYFLAVSSAASSSCYLFSFNDDHADDHAPFEYMQTPIFGVGLWWTIFGF